MRIEPTHAATPQVGVPSRDEAPEQGSALGSARPPDAAATATSLAEFEAVLSRLQQAYPDKKGLIFSLFEEQFRAESERIRLINQALAIENAGRAIENEGKAVENANLASLTSIQDRELMEERKDKRKREAREGQQSWVALGGGTLATVLGAGALVLAADNPQGLTPLVSSLTSVSGALLAAYGWKRQPPR